MMIDNDLISFKQVASLLGDEKMDKRTISKWLIEQKIKIHRIAGKLRVNSLSIKIAKEKFLVESLKHQFEDKWVMVYEVIAVDDILKKIILQINDKELVSNVTYESKYFKL